jgi:DivIVA domain-containing protein
MLTTTDISNKKFEKKMGGYKVVEVNSFLVEVSSTISQINRENADLKRRLDVANKKLSEYESEQSTLTSALLNAHRMAETVVKDANAKAELTVRYAEIRAEKITEKVKESIIAEQDEFVRLKKEITDFRSGVLDTYKKHIELILAIPAQVSIETQKNDLNLDQGSETENIEIEKPTVTVENSPPQNITNNTGELKNNEIRQAEITKAQPIQDEKKESGFKLNLKFDDETGEYIPADSNDRRSKLQNLKFGSDYDISLDEDEKTDNKFFNKKK